MKLYSSIGPNPRLVRMLMAEKGLSVTQEEVDILVGENRQPAFLALNPTGTTPVLQLQESQCIAETTAICEYLEELHPQPVLIGDTPLRRAQVRMWWRRVDQMIVQPMTMGFRGAEGYGLFKERVACFPESSDGFKQQAAKGWQWLEAHRPQGDFLLGDQLSVVDLLAFCFAEFGEQVGQPITADCHFLQGWLQRMRARASAAA